MESRFETFTVLISKINRIVKKIKNAEMAEYGLRSAHVSCLYYLYSEKNLTATDLCERCEEDKATISRTLDYLEEHGYLLRENSTAKRYKAPIALTEQGKVAGERIEKKIRGVLTEMQSELSEEERIEFYRCLRLITERLNQIANSDT